jgi:tetratricopeptide (TPR) repeat protein
MLVRGQNRWQVTNVDENTEINYWLSMVRGALSLRSGRNIPVTAPLFTEMGQLLDDAHRSYAEGVTLKRANRRGEALIRFSYARQKTQEIKLIFPVNQDAGMLELRMDQVTDPEAFNASFQRRLNEAIAGTKRRSAESFADLQNLAELNPRYPGIAEALSQAEIDMGYRTAPPDPRTLQRSNELTQAAQAIVDANAREQFEAALRQLNEALTLNPNNTQAMTLKDRVQTQMGAGNAVLSSASEGEYQRAVRELQQGNTLVAMSIVETLLQNPQNRGSTRVLELQRRIQSVL